MSRANIVAAAGVLVLCVPVMTSAATIPIDDFTTPVGQNGLSTTSGLLGIQVAPGAIGGRRELQVTRDTGAAPLFDTVTVTQYSVAGTSFLDFDQTSGAEGSVELTYDSASGDLNADLSVNRKVQIDLSQFNPGEGTNMTATVTLFDGVNTVSAFATTTGNGAQSLIVDFTSAALVLDFSSVNSIAVLFDAPLAGDFRVTGISALDALVVPEPATLALLGVGALLARRRR